MITSHKTKSENYFRSTVKCHQNANFQDFQQEKMMNFDFCEEYLRSISEKKIVMAVLEKKIHSADKKTIMKKRRSRRKIDVNFDFSAAVMCS